MKVSFQITSNPLRCFEATQVPHPCIVEIFELFLPKEKLLETLNTLSFGDRSSQDPGRYEFLRMLLEELPEFGPRVLEVMRQPIEDKIVTTSRTHGPLTFPAIFQLIALLSTHEKLYL